MFIFKPEEANVLLYEGFVIFNAFSLSIVLVVVFI